MKVILVAFYVFISTLNFSLGEEIEGDVVTGVIDVQPKPGSRSGGDHKHFKPQILPHGKEQGRVFQIRGTPKNPDFIPISCVARGPDGQKYKLKPGKTYKDHTVACLCDVVDLPPQQCGVAISCIDSSLEGNWTLIMKDKDGKIFEKSTVVNMHMHACKNSTPGGARDGRWGAWSDWSDCAASPDKQQERSRKCDSPPPSLSPPGKYCPGHCSQRQDCTKPECTHDWQCPEGACCKETKCGPCGGNVTTTTTTTTPNPEPECTQNWQCPETHCCIDQKCGKCEPPVECTVDNDCRNDENDEMTKCCIDQKCGACGGNVTTTTTTTTTTSNPEPECTHDWQCPIGPCCKETHKCGACGDPTTTTPGPACQRQEDCGEGECCTDHQCGECKAKECTYDWECTDGPCCKDTNRCGQCGGNVTTTPNPEPECTVDRECSETQCCINHMCGKCGPPTCDVDRECHVSQCCNNHTCGACEHTCDTDRECSETQCCINHTCGKCEPPTCDVDRDCSEAQCCNNHTCGTCEPGCTSNKDCPDGKCCNEDGECGDCSKTTTTPAPSGNCTHDWDCPFGQHCCKDTNTCGKDGHCGAVTTTTPHPKTTTTTTTPTQNCTSNKECPPGKCCYDGDCGDCPVGDCPESWDKFGDFCYKFFVEKLSWSDAWHDCKDKENAHLASILSHEENCFVSHLIHSDKCEEPCKLYPFWLDGRFPGKANKHQHQDFRDSLKWTDGSTPTGWTNWEPRSNSRRPGGCGSGKKAPCYGEPQDLPGYRCMHGGVDIIGTVSARARSAPENEDPRCYTWGNQQKCTKTLPYVCKMPKGMLNQPNMSNNETSPVF